MRKLICSTALALVSFVPGSNAATAATSQPPLTLVVPVSMPEPSSPMLLAVDLLAVGVLMFVLRHRISRSGR